jgi:hypothetical protein
MSCHDFERLIALYVEDDVYVAELRQLESHLQSCPACRSLAEELRESQAAFKSIRQDVPDPVMLVSMRRRVLNEVAGMQSGSWLERLFFGGLQRATLAGIALLMIGGWLVWNSREPERNVPVAVPPVPVVTDYQPPVFTAETVTPTAPRESAPKPRVRRQRPMPAVAVPEEQVELSQPVTIRFVTDNPNVIIYWLGDERKGD